MVNMVASPFDPVTLEEIPLARAPLVNVLAQVRWPPVTYFETNLEEIAHHFGRLIGDQYPLFNKQHEMQINLTSNGVRSEPAGVIFQFQSADEIWRVSISGSFVALDTKKYTSRGDFGKRLVHVLDCLTQVAKIPFAARIGFRYVNRVDDEDIVDRLNDLVDFAAMGGGAVPLGENGELVHSLSEAVYRTGGDQLLVRSAHLPPGTILDPSIQPSAKRSWTLDIDAFTEGRVDFDPEKLVASAERLSHVGYRFFRWATKPEFLRLYGGEV
jgi:uncharacterized protein (TIGR04255 family)